MDILVLVSVLSPSLVLLSAGAQHLAKRSTLRSRMAAHGVLAPRSIAAVVVTLPLMELLIAAGVIYFLGVSSRSGLIASLVLQAVMYSSLAAYLVVVVRGGNAGVPCGCGVGEAPVGGPVIARAIVLGLLSATAAIGVGLLGQTLTVGLDTRGLLSVTAGLTLAILLVILVPARRLEASADRPDTPGTSNRSPLNPADRMTMGSV